MQISKHLIEEEPDLTPQLLALLIIRSKPSLAVCCFPTKYPKLVLLNQMQLDFTESCQQQMMKSGCKVTLNNLQVFQAFPSLVGWPRK